MIYNLYIFNKDGKCIFYKEWHRENTPDNLEEEQELLHGFLIALRAFVNQTSPSENDTFNCYTTNKYKLHYFETPSGFKFVLNSDPKAPNMKNDLSKIYSDYFVEYVVKNPSYNVGDVINCSLFESSVENYIQKHSVFE